MINKNSGLNEVKGLNSVGYSTLEKEVLVAKLKPEEEVSYMIVSTDAIFGRTLMINGEPVKNTLTGKNKVLGMVVAMCKNDNSDEIYPKAITLDFLVTRDVNQSFLDNEVVNTVKNSPNILTVYKSLVGKAFKVKEITEIEKAKYVDGKKVEGETISISVPVLEFIKSPFSEEDVNEMKNFVKA